MLFFSKRGNCEKCKYPCTRTLLHKDDETLKLSLLRLECQDLIMITHMWSLINDVILKKGVWNRNLMIYSNFEQTFFGL